MQSDSRVMDLVYGAVFGSLFPLFHFAARSFTRRERGHEIADQIANAFMVLRPRYLEAILGNTAQVLGLRPTHARVEQTAHEMVRQHARAWVDFFHFGQRPVEEALAQFASLEGMDRFDAVLAEGRGAILLTAHAGNFELGGILLRSRNLKVHAVYKPDRFAAVERLREGMRAQGGVVGIPVDGVGFSTLPLVRLLREGALVGMQGDRDFSLNGVPMPFFGREVPFPRGPWELAAMTGAPIITSFFYTDGDRRFHAHFGEPIRIEGGRGERMAAIQAGMRSYVADLEALIRRHPSQWYCFYPFWDDPARVVP
ncbi:MAG: lysophospholipid acyltransferase family protein [Geothrix sp.]|uniref:lysophospholipid acyltransferase family protein n=1 Tax=Geothrix sp. TaxID=1962974 RepID=UPI0017B816DB|nr:lysophospholipid acyltransferase family protein [Geothrix sp.]NWJ41454.1 lysophospholipid acyltransferase family protein [Geothrix sp.]WIL20561.1 MAG: lysophospholipid acyltransferase family protein [Geothrix sp.]